jgi:hypothetical protein
MTYEGIEFAIRAGLGRNEWVATIHFPDAIEPLVIHGQGHGNPRGSNRADAGSHSQLVETAEAEGARHQLNLVQMNGTSYRSMSYCAVLFAACLLRPT